MTPADSYRARASELRARAIKEANPTLAAQWDHLARCYIRLAEQADQNSLLDLWLEFSPTTGFSRDGDGA